MASDKSLYPQAISELRQYVAQHPQENAPRVALGKALTWREETRREGIALLEPMASGNKEADSGLRQALLWLGPQAGDEQYYDTWMQRHPRDSEVQNYFRERRSGQARGQGYANLNSGNTAAAKQQFEEVLQTNPGCRCAGGHGLYRPAQRRLPGRVAVSEPGRGPRRRRLGDPSSAGGRCAVLRPAGAGPAGL
ncbi:hypothetical protein NVV48_19340 [Klebsiella pneumoniae]|nr:hypothetical protein [Klebsiella pneumoniae]